MEEFTAGNLKLLKIARSLMRLKAIKIGLEAWGIVTRNFYEELPRKRTVMQNAFHKSSGDVFCRACCQHGFREGDGLEELAQND